MNQLSDRLNRLSPSATLAMSQKSSEMKAAGIDVINLSVGEPDFNTPDHIKTSAKKAIDDNWSRYSPVPGYADLREAIVAVITDEPKTATTLIAEAGVEIKPQAIPSLLKGLVADGGIAKTEVKVTGKGKQVGYVRA